MRTRDNFLVIFTGYAMGWTIAMYRSTEIIHKCKIEAVHDIISSTKKNITRRIPMVPVTVIDEIKSGVKWYDDHSNQ